MLKIKNIDKIKLYQHDMIHFTDVKDPEYHTNLHLENWDIVIVLYLKLLKMKNILDYIITIN
jgi:hypothetical protein